MALFSQKKKNNTEEKVATKEMANPVISKSLPTDVDLSGVLLKQRVTEKAVQQNDRNVYTFIVHRDATKFSVADAITSIFKVTPVKVNIVNKSPRQYMAKAKGRKFIEKGMKKAYVYLKKGDRIDLV